MTEQTKTIKSYLKWYIAGVILVAWMNGLGSVNQLLVALIGGIFAGAIARAGYNSTQQKAE